jgi:hypothetical protein
MNAEDTPPKPIESDGEWDVDLYIANRQRFPQEELDKYAGKQVAFSLDGKCILASGEDMEEVAEALIAAGIDLSRVVFSYVGSLDVAEIG